MLKLAAGIASRGYPVDLVLARAEGPFMAEVPDLIRLVDLKARRVVTSLPALTRYLRQEKPFALLALLHANMVAVWASRLGRVPMRLFVSERNTLSTESQQFSSDLRLKVMPVLARLFYPWADCVIAVSGGVASDLRQITNLPPERIKVIYNPIITPEFQLKANMPLEHPWFKPGEPPVILSVGRLSVQKGFDILIRAFDRVRQHRQARLIIIGEGEQRPALEALVSQLRMSSAVEMPGFIPNPYPYMVKAAVFVLSSRWEGLPGVLIEALYCSPRLISTDCPSGAREILANGKYGRLVPVDDVEQMESALLAALDGDGTRPGTESWRPFELETIVDQYIHLMLD